MALNISNEVKVGALTAISITLLILGFNFLKGNNPMKRSQYIFAKFEKIEGLVPSNPVLMNGLVIGSVYNTEPADEYLNEVLVTIRLNEPVKIPKDSKATIKGNLLSTPVIEITKGSLAAYLSKGDTIQTMESSGFIGSIMEQLGPTQKSLNIALLQLDTLLAGANEVLNARGKEDLRQILSNLSVVTAELAEATTSVNSLLKQQQNGLKSTFENLQATSNQLKEGTKNLPAILENLKTTTDKLSELELKNTLTTLDKTLDEVNNTLAKVQSKEGTIGALLSDRKLYNNLTTTSNSLNLLLQDLRLHPKRYINVSVFGKKDKTTPLMKPMQEDSVTQEQFKNN
jgi:phospholipid/cholesterol/gamma-HCH transport system substrate-binding protein